MSTSFEYLRQSYLQESTGYVSPDALCSDSFVLIGILTILSPSCTGSNALSTL